MKEIPWPDPPLRNEVVALRPWREADVPGRIMGFADPSVLRFSWASPGPYTQADAREFFQVQAEQRRSGRALNLAFVAVEDEDTVLGGGSVYDIELDQGRAAVGYWLTPAARGRGVATHATRLMAGHAIEGLGIARLEITCAPDNEPSIRLAARCGFTREGRLRSHLSFQGGRRDTVVFGLLAGDLR